MESTALATTNLMLFRSWTAQTLSTPKTQTNSAELTSSTRKQDNQPSSTILKWTSISLIFPTKTCKPLHLHSQLHNRWFNRIQLIIDRTQGTLWNLDSTLQIWMGLSWSILKLISNFKDLIYQVQISIMIIQITINSNKLISKNSNSQTGTRY